MKLFARGSRVVVKRDEVESVSPGGIVLPDVAQKKPQKGTVISAGPGKRLDDGGYAGLDLSAGDRVLFTAYAGEEFTLDGSNKVLLIRDEDIIAIIED